MSRKKSVLKDDNPAMNFISSASIDDDEAVDNDEAAIIENLDLEEAESGTATRKAAPEGYKLDPRYIEKKTKRVQLIMQPSLYSRLKEAAESEGESINNFIHDLIASYLDAPDDLD